MDAGPTIINDKIMYFWDNNFYDENVLKEDNFVGKCMNLPIMSVSQQSYHKSTILFRGR
jgi:hypothetical protein